MQSTWQTGGGCQLDVLSPERGPDNGSAVDPPVRPFREGGVQLSGWNIQLFLLPKADPTVRRGFTQVRIYYSGIQECLET